MTPGGNISFVAVGATGGVNIISVAVYATGGGNIISVAFNATVGGNINFVALIDTCFPVSISSAIYITHIYKHKNTNLCLALTQQKESNPFWHHRRLITCCF